MNAQRIGDIAQISRDRHLHALRGQSKSDRINGIVRNSEAGDVEIADREPASGLEHL